jgi:WXG100 family type VII secretion target
MTTYQVDSEQVLLASRQAQSAIARVQSEVAALNSHLHSLSSSWRGPAASAFAQVHSQWRATQVRVEENLQALSQSLAQAGRHYQEMEATNSRLFQS